jgi:hypothetical protein
MDPARFAQGMTFAQYLDFVGTPENLAREARVASALFVTVRSRTP